MMYVEFPLQHFVVETGLACIIISTIRSFIVAPTQASISYIRVLTAVLYCMFTVELFLHPQQFLQ